MPLSQLTVSERLVLHQLHQAGCSNAQIARRLGRHRATVGRELARNRDPRDPRDPRGHPGGYHPGVAQGRAEQRRTRANTRRDKLGPSTPLGRYVRDRLRQRWSPQQISGRLERGDRWDGDLFRGRVSHETIYRWVYRRHRDHGERWHERLRRRRKRRRVRCVGERASGGQGVIPGRVGIEQRPAVVNSRGRFGDWESDTVEGRKGAGLVVTHVERRSRYVRIGKLTDKKAATLSEVTRKTLRGLPRKLRRTATFDNGKEFADFKTLERRLKLRVYFANPHAPWERGTNENTNGLLRDWWPKGTDFRRVTDTEVAKVQQMLNNRPRKCLAYRTPLEVLNALPGVALRK